MSVRGSLTAPKAPKRDFRSSPNNRHDVTAAALMGGALLGSEETPTAQRKKDDRSPTWVDPDQGRFARRAAARRQSDHGAPELSHVNLRVRITVFPA
jgi:hypothetical protein